MVWGCVYKCRREWKFQEKKIKVHKILIFLRTIYSPKATLIGSKHTHTQIYSVQLLVCSKITFEIWVLEFVQTIITNVFKY